MYLMKFIYIPFYYIGSNVNEGLVFLNATNDNFYKNVAPSYGKQPFVTSCRCGPLQDQR